MLPENAKYSIDKSYKLADGSEVVKTVYSEDSMLELQGYSTVVIADTLRPSAPLDGLLNNHIYKRFVYNHQRVTTIVARFPRAILAELNTHRVFSRNSASSRARSIKVVIAEVMEDPYVPVFTENQKGMGGPIAKAEVQAAARKEWLITRDYAVSRVLTILLGRKIESVDIQNGMWRNLTDEYYERVYINREDIEGSLNLHKQNINRLLEPFMWHEAVITSTEWLNFLELRDHDDADPAIHALAYLIKNAIFESVPVERVIHAPFAGALVREFEEKYSKLSGIEQFKLAFQAANYSAGAAAQISYRPVTGDGTGADPEKLAKRLLNMSHLSPFEHAAFSADWLYSLGLRNEMKSNLSSDWVQHRPLIAFLRNAPSVEGLEEIMAFSK